MAFSAGSGQQGGRRAMSKGKNVLLLVLVFVLFGVVVWRVAAGVLAAKTMANPLRRRPQTPATNPLYPVAEFEPSTAAAASPPSVVGNGQASSGGHASSPSAAAAPGRGGVAGLSYSPAGLDFPNRTHPWDATRNLTRRIIERQNGTIAFEEAMLDGGASRRYATRGAIFASVAAYRDEQCLPTLVDMFDKAKFPASLFVGLVDQRIMGHGVKATNAMVGNLPDQPCLDFERDCLPGKPHAATVLCRFVSNVRIAHVPNNLAKGPTFGRFAASMMRRNESFYMMIDSHNRFTRFWDLRAITQVMDLIKKGVSKPVLSHYPDAWRNPGDAIEARNGEGGSSKAGNQTIGPQPPLDGRRATAYLCKAKFLQTGIPRLDGLMVPVTLDKRPRPQPWAAAGFIFAPAKLPSEVPFDPYLDYLFDGEEILYSVRMWTHGWDIYSPGENILFHYYYRRKSKRVFQDTRGWAPSQLRSIHRVQHILKLNPVRPDLTSHSRVTGVGTPPKNSRVFLKLDVYGLGANRTLKQYWEYAGGDPVKRTFDKDFCKMHYNG